MRVAAEAREPDRREATAEFRRALEPFGRVAAFPPRAAPRMAQASFRREASGDLLAAEARAPPARLAVLWEQRAVRSSTSHASPVTWPTGAGADIGCARAQLKGRGSPR